MHLPGPFAANGAASLEVTPAQRAPTDAGVLESDVLEAVLSLGYDAVPQVGAASYRIDVAVRHPTHQGSYALAVECDGPTYDSAKNARDRDRLRATVLHHLGWQVHRIWGISWAEDRARQIQRLRAAIEAAARARAIPPARAQHTPVGADVQVQDVDLQAPPAWARPYTVTPPARADASTPPFELHEPEARPRLQTYLARVIATEAPVHEDILFERLRRDWDIGRVGNRIRDNARLALERVTVDNVKVVKDRLGFYRVPGRDLTIVRIPENGNGARPVALIPPEELELAVLNVVSDAGTAEPDAVADVVKRIFGWQRMGSDIESAIDATITRLTRQARLVTTDHGTLRLAALGETQC